MSKSVLILGESGTGKSTAIRTLPSKFTFILNVIGKPLPFRGWRSEYQTLSADGSEGNYYASDDPATILRVIKLINSKRPDILYLVIDDFGYMITNSFMRKALVKGYDKFAEIGKDAFDILNEIQKGLRENLFCFVMMHTEIDAHGKYKPKTIGKMIDQHVTIEGKFTYVFHALVSEGGYVFLTNNDGVHMAKTPLGLYEETYIPNDLLEIVNDIDDFEQGEEENE